jgi:hypothetical protein
MSPIIPAAALCAAPSRVTILLHGPTGVGKTSLLRTLDPTTTLSVDVEAGNLSVQDLAIDTIRPRTWPECRDLAVWLAGANPAVPADAAYGEKHLDEAIDKFDMPEGPTKYRTVDLDSITAIGRLCFDWSQRQPEAFSERSGKRDLRGAYGLHAREMCAWLLHLQQARALNIVFIGILETVVDDFNRTEHRLQMEGGRTSRELPAIVDEIITMQMIKFDGDNTPTRAFVCNQPNPWNYPAKDRSGRLEQIEEPNLGKLIDKITRPGGRLVQFPLAAESKQAGGSDGNV